MKTTLTFLLLLILPAIANAQETTTVYDLSGGTPRIVSRQSRDSKMILIQRGSTVVIQTAPKDYYGGWSGYRTHRLYGRSFRGYYRGAR